MEGLPTDFSVNPQLAALASLLNDDEDDDDQQHDDAEEQESTTRKERDVPIAGGGKCRKIKSRQRRKATPYNVEKKKEKFSNSKDCSCSVSEMHLFLKMWKM